MEQGDISGFYDSQTRKITIIPCYGNTFFIDRSGEALAPFTSHYGAIDITRNQISIICGDQIPSIPEVALLVQALREKRVLQYTNLATIKREDIW